MQVTRLLTHPARAVLAATVAATALSLAPVVTAPVIAASAVATTDSAECAAAKTALAQARAAQRTAKANLVKARKTLRKAQAAHQPVKVRKAKKAVKRALGRYRARIKTAHYRGVRMSYACSAPTSAARASGTGKKLALLALADGLPLDVIGLDQLTALLDRFLPGLSGDLTEGQLSALLSGFNAVAGLGELDPMDALALLGGSFGAADITSLLDGVAGPELLGELAEHILGQLGGLGGGLPLPGGFDPADVLETFAGLFGALDPTQLGRLLALVTSAVGGGSSAFDLEQLTGLLDTLVPGLTDGLDADVLTSLLAGLNGGGLSADTLANLLGGAFSPDQLTSVLGGTAGTALVGEVIATVMAQLGTLGGGGLELPGTLDLETLTDLVSTVTDLIGALFGGGGLPVICGIIPLPFLCP